MSIKEDFLTLKKMTEDQIGCQIKMILVDEDETGQIIARIGKDCRGDYFLKYNHKVNNLPDGQKYSIFAHELGHVINGDLDKLTDLDILMNFLERLGAVPRCLNKEIEADKWALALSKNDYIQCIEDEIRFITETYSFETTNASEVVSEWFERLSILVKL